MASNAGDACCHREVRTVLASWAVKASTLQGVWIVSTGLAWLLNDETSLAEVAGWTWVAVIGRFNRWIGHRRAFLADVAGSTRSIVVLSEGLSKKVGKRIAFLSSNSRKSYVAGIRSH